MYAGEYSYTEPVFLFLTYLAEILAALWLACWCLLRGGHKLEAAIENLGIDVAGKVALDSGLSTGGFTDCLLQYGASFVYGVDVGYGQVTSLDLKDDAHKASIFLIFFYWFQLHKLRSRVVQFEMSEYKMERMLNIHGAMLVGGSKQF